MEYFCVRTDTYSSLRVYMCMNSYIAVRRINKNNFKWRVFRVVNYFHTYETSKNYYIYYIYYIYTRRFRVHAYFLCGNYS